MTSPRSPVGKVAESRWQWIGTWVQTPLPSILTISSPRECPDGALSKALVDTFPNSFLEELLVREVIHHTWKYINTHIKYNDRIAMSLPREVRVINKHPDRTPAIVSNKNQERLRWKSSVANHRRFTLSRDLRAEHLWPSIRSNISGSWKWF